MSDQPNRPLEGEIIPPGEPLPDDRSMRFETDWRGRQRVYVRPIGPIGAAVLTIAAGAVAALVLVFVLGAAFFGLAAIGVLTLIGIIAGLLRGPTRPLR